MGSDQEVQDMMCVELCIASSYATGIFVTAWAQVMAWDIEPAKPTPAERLATVITTLVWPITIAVTTVQYLKGRHD